jgi:hypothetical protein
MNQGGPSTRACYLPCCLPQRVLRALAHRQQGHLNCAVLVVMPHLQKPTRPIVRQKENTTSVIKEGWERGREPLAAVAASYFVWFEIPPWEKEIIQNPDFHPPTEHTRKASLVSYVGGNPRDAVSVVCQANADNSDTWAVLLQRMHAVSIRVLPPSVGVGKNHSHDPKGGSLVVAVDRQVLRPSEGDTCNINCIY